MATLGTEESGRCGEVAIMERLGVIRQILFSEYNNVYCAKLLCLLYPTFN